MLQSANQNHNHIQEQTCLGTNKLDTKAVGSKTVSSKAVLWDLQNMIISNHKQIWKLKT